VRSRRFETILYTKQIDLALLILGDEDAIDGARTSTPDGRYRKLPENEDSAEFRKAYDEHLWRGANRERTGDIAGPSRSAHFIRITCKVSQFLEKPSDKMGTVSWEAVKSCIV
jgi:hypothetical protein